MRTRTRIRPAIVILATATAITAVSVTDAHGTTTATQVYSGDRWAISAPWITHLDALPWQIHFNDTTSRTKLTAYAKVTAAELTKYTGLTVAVTTTIKAYTPGKCPVGHTVILKYDTTEDRSNGSVCRTAAHAANGGYIRFSASNWLRKSWSTQTVEAYRKNVVSHETAHLFGLGHPKSCGTSKPLPLMCGEKWGGYGTTASGGKYTTQDANGLKNLVANRYKVPPITAP